MSDPPEVIIKTTNSSLPQTLENGETSRSPAASPAPTSPAVNPPDNGNVQRNSSFLRRHLSKRFSRSSSMRSDANVDAITLEESVGRKRQPVTLKASFLRRKIEEYEGKSS